MDNYDLNKTDRSILKYTVRTTARKLVSYDTMRYKKNSLASNLAILSLLFEFLFFLTVYGQKSSGIEVKFSESVLGGEYVYTYMMGLSVLLNLVILLGVFLASQEIKNYNKRYCYFVWAVAIVQIVRIFLYPMQVYNATLASGSPLIAKYSYIFMIVWLVLSALCLAASGAIGYYRTKQLETFNKDVPVGSYALEAAYKVDNESKEEAEGGSVNA